MSTTRGAAVLPYSDPLPPAFDAGTYLARNPDLAPMSDPAAAAHYRREGRAAGRVASSLAEREGLLARLSGLAHVLEIGPFCTPLLSGQQVEYHDVLDAAQLRARAIEIGEDPAGCPDHIHHVGDLAQIDRRFDAVISSHAIEHQPDLVRHLREIGRLLEPDGALYLIIPDKRFCFDHFLPESGIAKVLQAWSEGRRIHGLDSIVEHMALTTHNDAGRHWAGDHGDPARGRGQRLRAALERFAQNPGAYVDVHAWQFTPDSFRALIEALGELGLIGLEIGEVYDTPHGRHEFCAILRLSAAALAAKRAALHQILRDDVAIADAVHIPSQMADLADKARNISEEIARLTPGAEARQISGFEPRLAEALGAPPASLGLIDQIIDRWRDREIVETIPEAQRELVDALDAGNAAALATMLAEAGRQAFAQGVLGGAGQHRRAQDPLFARRLARSAYDRLIALAEAVGALDVENPEGGGHGLDRAREPARLFDAVERALGADLSPPPTVGRYLGIAVGHGRVMHPRMLDAIHAVWRLRALATLHGLQGVTEIGGGAGLTAFYAGRLGLGPFHIVGSPVLAVLQRVMLNDASAGSGELPDRVALLFNQDSLPGMPADAATALLRSTRDRGAQLFLSINPDDRAATGGDAQTPVRDLVDAAGGWRAAGRHRHWLRAGHVEEAWLADRA